MKLLKLWEADFQKAFDLQNSFEADENGFINQAYGYTFDEFKHYVARREGYSRGTGLPDGFVPDTAFVLVNDADEYVGLFSLRHCLNDSLANGSGHIGYGIRKEYRGRGYASEGLKLVIKEAWATIPEQEIYLCVNKDNPASLRVQLKNGAYICHEDEKKYYTRIKKVR